MPEEMEMEKPKKKNTSKVEGQVTLTEMLKALDKDVATGLEKRLKKLSKKKAIEKPLDEQKAAQLERIDNYSVATKEVSKWDPIVDHNRKARTLSFPLDREPDQLPTTAESIDGIKPRNDLEHDVQKVIDAEKAAKMKQVELTRAEEQYQKAISADEARERHKELQRMRVKLGTFAAKMRRQKGIKSKSYHRLLKHERIRKHVKKVESNQDALVEEIERLQKLRAKERATLKHKNTGKWAKHAKFRSKYDEEARKAMLEQIGIAGKLLEKPAPPSSDSEGDEKDFGDNNFTSDDEEDEEGEISEVSEESGAEDEDDDEKETSAKGTSKMDDTGNDRLIVSTELLEDRPKRARRAQNDEDSDADGGEEEEEEDADEEDDEQRKLMSEAFADDDVVGEFKEAKDKLADEEQPKDINTFLPGWGDWAGPGLKVSKRKSKKFIIKAKKIKRKDANLGNVIISEKANEVIKELQPKSLPRGFKSDDQLKKFITNPTASTFLDQSAHRDKVRPRIETRMGQRIEPINQRMLTGAAKADWV